MIKATILSAKDVGINNKDISDNALKVVKNLQDAGYTAYLVGGCVRDLLLNTKPKDFDVATNATPEKIKEVIKGSRIIGRRFKLVHVRFGYEVIEVATFRANANDRDRVGTQEMSEGDQGQLLRDNVYGTIEEDVVRRDFKANALYYDPFKEEILDFVNSLDDIKQRKLCSIGEAKQRFKEDPVRMLRVIRFAGKLGFEMEQEALEMIEQEGGLLSNVSPARLFDEVLKLFHGGAAYETYLLLRKYGVFKYLFPFTDHSVVTGEEGMPERALKNTDKRIAIGKPVIPAFLFASMMWDPVQADARILMNDGTPESQAWKIAMNDGLRDQNQYVAVPRRLAEIIIDIWEIHFRLIKRNPRMVKSCLSNRRFRAAYDFLLLRSSLHEVDQEIADWWTQIQEVDTEEREEMILQAGEVYKSQRNQKQSYKVDGEANGNSINYNSSETDYNRVSTSQDNTNYKGKTRRRTNQSNGRPTRQKSGYNRSKTNTKSANPNSTKKTRSNRGRSRPGQAANANQGRNQNKNRRRPSTARKDAYAADARPKDEFGNYQVSSSTNKEKKVKVRHKRKIVSRETDTPTDETPIF